MQEPVLQPCALDHNIVGKLEAALKGPLGDALVENVAGLFLVVGLFLADEALNGDVCNQDPGSSMVR